MIQWLLVTGAIKDNGSYKGITFSVEYSNEATQQDIELKYQTLFFRLKTFGQALRISFNVSI